MKHVFRLFASMAFVLFVAVSMNAQTATTVSTNTDSKKCEAKKCNPAMCDAMVKAGLCTKEEAAACKAKCSSKTTKVASASVEKGQAVTVAATKQACSSAKAKACSKTCTKKTETKSE